jgi:hypothetical protein
MTTTIVTHEVEDGALWAKAWHKGPGSRHEMFAELGIKARTFRDPDNPKQIGVLMEIPDIARFKAFLETDQGKAAMREDGLKIDSMKMMTEFTP